MADTHSIHLVRPSQPKPEPLDAKDIAAEALAIAKECSETLSAFEDYQDTAIREMHAQLIQLEIVALRAMKARKR